MKQPGFAALAYEGRKKQTRKDRFLTQKDKIIAWILLAWQVAPCYSKGRNGRPAMGIEKALRIYFMQQWFGL